MVLSIATKQVPTTCRFRENRTIFPSQIQRRNETRHGSRVELIAAGHRGGASGSRRPQRRGIRDLRSESALSTTPRRGSDVTGGQGLSRLIWSRVVRGRIPAGRPLRSYCIVTGGQGLSRLIAGCPRENPGRPGRSARVVLLIERKGPRRANPHVSPTPKYAPTPGKTHYFKRQKCAYNSVQGWRTAQGGNMAFGATIVAPNATCQLTLLRRLYRRRTN